MRKVLLLAVLLLNLLPMFKNGSITLGTLTLSAQNMGNESGSSLNHCEDEDGFEYTSPWECDKNPCITTCDICHESMSCDKLEGHKFVQHNEEDKPKDPDEGKDSGQVGGHGSGGHGSGNHGSGDGGHVIVGPPSDNTSSSNKRSTTKIKNAAEKSVRSIPGTDAQCSEGVRLAFKNLYGSLPSDMNCDANSMTRYWMNNPAKWGEIKISEAQSYANQGYFVVAGYINPGGHGHVVVVVPGKEWNSPGWGGKVPSTMDTGWNKRYSSGNFADSFGKNKRGKVKFFYYK